MGFKLNGGKNGVIAIMWLNPLRNVHLCQFIIVELPAQFNAILAASSVINAKWIDLGSMGAKKKN